MGTGYGGITSLCGGNTCSGIIDLNKDNKRREVTALRGGNRFDENIEELISKFKLTASGYFGKSGKGRSHTRNIASNNPARTAAEFTALACKNPVSVITIEGKGLVYRMRDGSIITHRYFSSSTDGSPVVELNIKNVTKIKSQKIHFIKEGK